MNIKDISNWLYNKINSCYPVLHNDNKDMIYWFYDESYIRKVKLCKLIKQEIIKPTNISGVCIIEQYVTKDYLFFDYNEIWKFIKDNYSNDYIDIKSIIKYTITQNYNVDYYITSGSLTHIGALKKYGNLRLCESESVFTNKNYFKFSNF